MRLLRLRQLGADLLGEIIGEVALVGGGAVDVVEVAIGGDARIDRAPQLVADGVAREAQLHRSRCRRGDGEQEIADVRLCVPISSAAERPSLVSEAWRKANRFASAAAGRWMLRSSSPGCRTLAWLPVTKSTAGTVARRAIARPQR